MFCTTGEEHYNDPAVELRPDLLFLQQHGGHGVTDANDPADIVWTNRGQSSDGFDARFGAAAATARAVVDAVIVAYEQMIVSFNYATAGQTYNLNVSMSGAGSGFGASASLNSYLAGKPKGGSISMGAGSGTTPNGTGNGWFLDPTPYESSEFQGSIVNAFSGNAQSGSPASGKGDFYTVFAAELTHCIGLFGNGSSLWSSKTTASTVADTAEGGGIGKFFTFNGPSIQHLLTSNNGGSGGSDFNAAIHSAGPITTTLNGVTYNGAQDQGNAVYEFSRRYLVNNTFSLMFKDAYGYSSVDPAKFGTFYSALNETTGTALVRGGLTTSADNISITRSGSKITVSVDIGNDIAGTGALPGAGNLPAFVTEYDVSQLSGGLNIQAGDGNDTITLGANLGIPISVDGGTGTDTLVITGTAGDDAIAYNGTSASAGVTTANVISAIESVSFDGAAGNDTLTITGSTLADSLTINASTFTGARSGSFANVETIAVNLLGGSDTLNINAPLADVVADLGGGGSDSLDLTETAATKVVRLSPSADNTTLTVNVNVDASGGAVFDVPSATSFVGLSVNTGGSVTGAGDLSLSGSLQWTGGSIGGTGALNLAASGSFLANGPDAKLLGRTIASQTTLTLNAGTLTVAAGLSATAPAIVTTGLTIVDGATLDVTDNAVVIDYDTTSPLTAIGTALASGYAAGAWTGTGINSSTAAATPSTTVGYGEASTLFSTFPAIFAGGTVDSTAVLLRYTRAGDVNLTRTVGFDDLLVLAQNYAATGKTFAEGNLNYSADGAVDFEDLLALAQNYGQSLVTAAPPARAVVAGLTKRSRVASGVLA